MDDTRFSRLENRVDEIKDDLADVKAEQRVTNHHIETLNKNMEIHSELVKSHVAGDDKIITEIAPLIEEFKFQQERKRRRIESLKLWGMRLGIPSVIIGILVGLTKIYSYFRSVI